MQLQSFLKMEPKVFFFPLRCSHDLQIYVLQTMIFLRQDKKLNQKYTEKYKGWF